MRQNINKQANIKVSLLMAANGSAADDNSEKGGG